MDKPSSDITSKQKKPNLLTTIARSYSGSITGITLSALSAWMIVTGLKGVAGFEVTRQSALADLLGIAIVIAIATGIAHWVKLKYHVK
jgi:hypothetical protein